MLWATTIHGLQGYSREREREREIQEKKNNLISFHFIHFWYFKNFAKLSPFYTLHCLHILAWKLGKIVKVTLIWWRRTETLEIVSLCYSRGDYQVIYKIDIWQNVRQSIVTQITVHSYIWPILSSVPTHSLPSYPLIPFLPSLPPIL